MFILIVIFLNVFQYNSIFLNLIDLFLKFLNSNDLIILNLFCPWWLKIRLLDVTYSVLLAEIPAPFLTILLEKKTKKKTKKPNKKC